MFPGNKELNGGAAAPSKIAFPGRQLNLASKLTRSISVASMVAECVVDDLTRERYARDCVICGLTHLAGAAEGRAVVLCMHPEGSGCRTESHCSIVAGKLTNVDTDKASCCITCTICRVACSPQRTFPCNHVFCPILQQSESQYAAFPHRNKGSLSPNHETTLGMPARLRGSPVRTFLWCFIRAATGGDCVKHIVCVPSDGGMLAADGFDSL